MNNILKKWLLPLAAVFILSGAAAQETTVNATGTLRDATDGSGLIGATVLFQNVKDSTKTRYTVTGLNGEFTVTHLEKAFYRITIQSLGYVSNTRIVRVGELDLPLGVIKLEPDTKMLNAIEIKGDVVPVEQKGDTVQYNADAFKVNADASSLDLVKKMPGIVVDQSGISANGETVQQVLLDGKRFFGQDPLLSLNTIPAEVVQKVEVFDQQSQQSQMTGFNDGKTTKTMNLVTKENKRNGVFGKLYGGYGTSDLYKYGGSLNAFKNDRRLTITGMSNNINQQNFSDDDLAGVSGGNGGFRPPGSGNNFSTVTQNGITKTNAIGVNFTDNWGKNITFEGSYFFNQSHNNNDQEVNRETFLTDETQYYNQTQDASTDNLNHRLNARMTYKINDKNTLILRPTFSFQNNESNTHTLGATTNESGELLNNTENQYLSNNEAYSLSNEMTFQHKFEKIGRSLSWDLTTGTSNTDRKNYYEDFTTDSLTEYLTDEQQHNVKSGITYTEPIWQSGQLSGTYEISYTDRSSDKSTYLQDSETGERRFSQSLSNTFESGYTTHNSSVHLANRAFGKFYDIGLSYQRAILNNDQVYPTAYGFNKSFNSLLPVVMGRVEFKGGGDMFLRYTGSTTAPSVTQLQSVINNSNPLFLSTGNADLSQSYTHSLMLRTRKTNADKNTSFSNQFRVENTSNYITNATSVMTKDSVLTEDVTAQRGAQISKPINLNGYWNVSGSSTYSILVSKLHSNLNTTLGVGYRRLPGQTNDVYNLSNTYTGSGRLSLVSNFSKDIDFNFYYDFSGNLVENSIQSGNNSHYTTQKMGGTMNLTFWKGFVFRNDVTYQIYNGISASSDFSYTLWNMSIAKKMLKNNLGELELSVYDLLNQNQSISQSVNTSYIQETRTQVLQQYFMLTFTYQLRKFGV